MQDIHNKSDCIEDWQTTGYKIAIASEEYKYVMKKRKHIYDILLEYTNFPDKDFIKSNIEELGKIETARASLEIDAMLEVAYHDILKTLENKK